MVKDKFSCIKTVIKTVHIALPSLYITNELVGVTDILESWKRQYVPQLEGVVVSYKNVSLSSNSGYVIIDNPVVHYDVKATFEIFCPIVGSIIKGKINRINNDYIGCLIHNTINVTIKRTDPELDWLANIIAIDNLILFKITCFDFHRRVVQVKGEISDECVKLMKEIPSFNTQTPAAVFKSQSTFYTSDTSEDDANILCKDENETAVNEDSNTQSPSLLAPRFSFKKESSHIFNVDHLAMQSFLGEQTTSHSDSSLSEMNSSKKELKENKVVSETAKLDDSDHIEINSTTDFKSSSKKKKKKKDKKLKDKSSKKTLSKRNSPKTSSKKKNKNSKLQLINDSLSSTLSSFYSGTPKKKKSSKKVQLLTNSDLLNSSVLNLKSESPETKNSDKKVESSVSNNLLNSSPPDLNFKSPKKKKSKKEKNLQYTSPILDFTSTKQEESTEFCSVPSITSIKEELKTDSSSPVKLGKKKKLKRSPEVGKPENDIENMMNALAAFEPSLEDQLSFNETLSSIKVEPLLETIESSKKRRKRESTDNENLPSKKKSDGDLNISTKKKKKSNKDKSKKKKKSTDRGIKKDKKKKSKDKRTKSKKDKIKGKKEENKKKKKSKKSSKGKEENMPSVKSEL